MSSSYEAERLGLDFETANPVPSISQDSRRDPPNATVNPSGRTPLNMGATAQLDQLAETANLKLAEYAVVLGANKGTGLVSVHPVRPGTDKSMPIRRNADQSIVLYLHGVFKDFPVLRPEGRLSCQTQATTDSKGVPCMIINLQGGLAKIKGRRTAKAEKK